MKKGDIVKVKGSETYSGKMVILAIYRNEDYLNDAFVSVAYRETMGAPRTVLAPIDALEIVPEDVKKVAL